MLQETIKLLAQVSDEELVQTYLRTQHDKYFSELYRRYSGKIYAKCLSFFKVEQLALDGVHDVFMKILTSLAKFEEKARFSTWVYSITYNHCVDELRRAKKINQKSLDEIKGEMDWEYEEDENWLDKFDMDEIHTILDNLHPQDKAVLLMKYMDDLSIKEIGEIIQKSESAVKMKIKRAKERFKNTYSPNLV